ncbi:MAG: putative two-component system response regulatory protein [Bacteroidota bacterium]|nr:putative two-component system response regulatory protein [Bacteroidota bacterium]
MPKEPIRILLADDDEDDRLFFKDAIEDLKMNTIVTTVNDGIQLMNYLGDSENQLPHVVFLDLNMPRKGGIECLQEIRNTKALKDLSIAIYSTSGSEHDIEETFIKGANVYIKKPNDFTSLKKVLSEVISINWQYHTSGLNKETFLLSI